MKTPIVKEIQGRKLDFLYTADGVKVNAANVSDLFINMANAVIRAQTIQDKMDEVKVLLEVDKKLYKSSYDEQLKEVFVRKFGNNTKIIIEHVNEIPKEKSGKFRFIKNNVNLV